MFINIGSILLVVTLTSYTQTVETPMPLKPNLKPILNGNDSINRPQETRKSPQDKKWKFKDFLKKYEPSTIWEQIDKQKKYNGLVLTNEEQLEIMIRTMDPTDELMELKVENGDPKIVANQSSRRQGRYPIFKPNKPFYPLDRFKYRSRLFELMKQAIYTTRNKMVIMQTYREKYKKSSLYKMGFLMNKADNAAKTFGKFSFRAYRDCLLMREHVMDRLYVTDILNVNERQLSLWFNVEILADLITENDLIAKQIFRNVTERRKPLFDAAFVD